MNEIEMTDEQIVNLIFERKVKIGETQVLSKNSFHEILAKLEERLCYGKISRREDTALRRVDDSKNTKPRKPSASRTVGLGRKAVYDFV